MVFTEMQLGSAVSMSRLGRYEIVKLVLEWVEVIKQNEDYRKLTQTELIDKALNDVMTNVATREKIEGLRKEMKKGAKPK
ncbi:hypothetical protein AGMMS49573_04930 [Endomicrobiia bacterium]|nr:hypothetical protein AGMMS49532_09320 [Endomicrobiia bacterium]GHT16163.1 hypothetical protein AGMMS49573_04930 [Endomicrobiia bacterium]GHT22896.1 hypothetical protein AGMMS49953_02540 [Endomicrobiia bacterium]GMO53542.1 MAG: hypothetical protein Ta2C_05280 [Candidatus Endomicrobium trichonymphae]